MNKNLELMNLIDMLRELDTEKNDSKTIKEVLNYIADKLEEFIDAYYENINNMNDEDLIKKVKLFMEKNNENN